MTDHPRQTIREAVKTLLTGAPFHAVETARAHNFAAGSLPSVAIYTLREPAQRSNNAQDLIRTVDLLVDIHLKAGDDLDDRADALCLIVEEKLAVRKLGGVTLSHFLAETTIGFNGEGEHRIGLARLRYAVEYRTTRSGAPA